MSTPRHDSTSDTPSPIIQEGATFTGPAAAREVPPQHPSVVHADAGAAQESSSPHATSAYQPHVHDAQHPHIQETVIGAAQNVLSRLASPATTTPHAHDAQHPHLQDSVLGAAQNVFSRLTSHSTPHATPAHQHDAQHPHMHEAVLGAAQNVFSRLTSHSHATPAPQQYVLDAPRERSAEAPVPMDAPQRAQGPAPTSISSHGGGSGGARPITPPPGVARIARSYPALPEAVHPPRASRGLHGVRRRTTGPYTDSETAYHAFDDRDPVRATDDRCRHGWLIVPSFSTARGMSVSAWMRPSNRRKTNFSRPRVKVSGQDMLCMQ
jgi:hypothetical protein